MKPDAQVRSVLRNHIFMLAAFRLFGQKLRECRTFRIFRTVPILGSALIRRSVSDIQTILVRTSYPHSIQLPDMLSCLASPWVRPVWGPDRAEGGT
jgi:hypothetical protein